MWHQRNEQNSCPYAVEAYHSIVCAPTEHFNLFEVVLCLQRHCLDARWSTRLWGSPLPGASQHRHSAVNCMSLGHKYCQSAKVHNAEWQIFITKIFHYYIIKIFN